jgi:hypothetical protein
LLDGFGRLVGATEAAIRTGPASDGEMAPVLEEEEEEEEAADDTLETGDAWLG